MRKSRSILFFSISVYTLTVFLSGTMVSASSETGAMPTPESVPGRYEGYIPCADCPGIVYELLLSEDGSYAESLFYTDRSEQPVVQTGTYTIEGDAVVLDKSDNGLKYFEMHPRGLLLRDIHGKLVAGDLSERYILTRKKESSDITLNNATLTLMQKKLAQGTGFYAVGNEPFWSLDIDFDTGMRFTSLTELSEMNTPPGREDKAQDADVTRYFAQAEGGTLIVTVSRAECSDTMSDERFPFKVRVDVKRIVDSDYTSFEGCGRYVMDPRLNDIWVLTNFDDRAVVSDDFAEGLPVLEFHLRDNRIVGSTECNRISGSFEARGYKIALRYIVSTYMACPNMVFEQEYLTAISDKTLHYAIKDGRLVLTDDSGMSMVFKKID